MVYLDRIYTKSGDQGQTSLGDGTRVSKTDRRIVAYGTVDELNSLIGVVIAAGASRAGLLAAETHSERSVRSRCRLCAFRRPQAPTPKDACAWRPNKRRSSSGGSTRRPSNSSRSRVLCCPGGRRLRPICIWREPFAAGPRSRCSTLAESTSINPQVTIYLNRLSDLLFVWARLCNDEGKSDVLWVPGKFRTLPPA